MFKFEAVGNSLAELRANILAGIGAVEHESSQLEFAIGAKSMTASNDQHASEFKNDAPKKRGPKPKVKAASEVSAAATHEANPTTLPAVAQVESFYVAETPRIETPPSLSLVDVKAALNELISKGESGMVVAVEILKSFGAAKLSELKPEYYNDLTAKVKVALFS